MKDPKTKSINNFDRQKSSLKYVNKNHDKMDAYALACGVPAYTEDLPLENPLYLKILFSPHAHAEIININSAPALAIEGVSHVITHKDVPHTRFTTAGQGFPEPSPYDALILDTKVRFCGDRVAAVLAETPEAAKAGVKALEVTYKLLESVFDPEQAISGFAPVIHDEKDCKYPIDVTYDPSKNLVAEINVEIGDFEGLNKNSDDITVLNRFTTGYTSHCAREPHAASAWIDHQGRIVIRSCTQVPWHIRRLVARALNLSVSRIRVIKPRIGGGFGGKQEMILEDLCAYAALKYNRSVLTVLTRDEVFRSARVRHPMINDLHIISTNKGIIKALKMDLLLNTGAYGGHGLTVASNAGSKTLSLFSGVPDMTFNARAVYTNLPVAGAFRGYGAIQAYFGLGVSLDIIADKLNIDPIEIYLKNGVKEGESPEILKSLGEGGEGCPIQYNSVGLYECIKQGAAEINWYKHHRMYRSPELNKGSLKRGVGMACILQGSGVPDIDMGAVTIKLNEDGSFNLLCGATDLGTGSDTLMAVIAAEILDTPPESFVVTSSDTDVTPFDVGAYASSTTFVTGEACRQAALKMKTKLINEAARIMNYSADELECSNSCIKKIDSINENERVTFADIGTSTLYSSNQHQISVTASNCSPTSPPPFSAQFAEVEVDIETGRVRIVNYVAAVDCGTPINPIQAEGQTEGGVVTAIGQALYEEYHFDSKGRMLNPNFEHYKTPGPKDTPRIKTILVPTWEPDGPFGAKSVSEVVVNGPMPAIANAIYDACGIRLYEAPFTPERVFKALKSKMNIE